MLRQFIVAGCVAAALSLSVSVASAAPIFVGTWEVDDGPSWTVVPPAYSGVAAATLLFGPALPGMHYAISTIDANPLNINFSAWVSTWAGACGGSFPCGTVVAENFVVSSAGLYANPGDTSAYVTDWAVGPQFTNFAFLVDDVPEPTALALIGAALLSLLAFVAMRRRADA